MLSFTRKTDYALISLAHMANQGGSCCSAREIAMRYHMPMPLLMNILKVLTQHGLARSERGPRGGYRLAKPPEEITLYDIIYAVDGPVSLVYCARPPEDPSGGPQIRYGEERSPESVDGREETVPGERSRRSCGCELTQWCPVRTPVHRVHHKLIRMLKEVTLAEIADHAGNRDHEPARSAVAGPGDSVHEVAHLPG